MLVRCVTSNGSTITLDKRYEVIEEQLGLYQVINDSGVSHYYPIECFEEVKKMSEKITLKIGDIVTPLEDWINEEKCRITSFVEDRSFYRPAFYDPSSLYESDYWYVNGIKFAKEDIIIPEQYEEVEPITPDNIEKVLEYNKISSNKYNIFTDEGIEMYYDYDNSTEIPSTEIPFCNPLWLQLVEVYTGRLKPLPKFDFKNHLADNHFRVFCKPIHSDSINKVEWSAGDGRTVVWSESNTIFTKCGVGFEATKENADILIKMAKLAEELK